MQMMQDRRTYRRICNNFQIKYPARQKDDRGLFTTDWKVVTACNFSAGGALFDYHKETREGTFIDLKIQLPNSKYPIKCVGYIVRTEESDSNPHPCRIAVSFMGIDEWERERVDRIVEELLATTLD